MASLRIRSGAVLALCLFFWTRLLVCEFKAVSIAFTDESDTLRLNLTSIGEILRRPEIQNKKLMVISIVGEMRGGKSFISGYPIRYLQNEFKGESWMGDAWTKTNGFSWGPGTDRNTTGIDLWDEFFIIEDENGEEVVPILLDTQGLFDRETTMTNNVRINAICMLVSSLMVMNFKEQITERDLQNWQLSADFAKVSSSVDDSVFELPELLVLIQNWANSHEYAYGLDGGRAYIDYKLADRENKTELNEVRKNIRSSFPKIESYLMPHPGLNVTLKNFRGTNGEVTDIYLKYVKHYVEYLFNPANLAIKQLQGKPMNAKSFYNLLVAIDKAFSSNEIPNVRHLGEALASLVYAIAHEKCLAELELNMQIYIDDEVIVGKEELEEVYDSEKENSIQCYESSQRIGSQGLREEYETKLIVDMEERFQSMEKKMDVTRKLHVSEIAEEAFNDFTEDLDQVAVRNPRNLDSLQQGYSELRNIAIDSYDEKLSNCEPHAMEFRPEFLGKISSYYERSKSAMRERIDAELERQRIQREKEKADERARQEAEQKRKAVAEKKRAEEKAVAAAAEAERARRESQKRRRGGGNSFTLSVRMNL